MSKVSLLNRKQDGTLRMVRVSEEKARQLSEKSQPEHIARYFDAVFSGKFTDDASKKRQFKRVFEATSCLNCMGLGYHNVKIDTDSGRAYYFAYGCTCEEGKKLNTASIMTLIQAGAYRMTCKLAQDCQMSERKHKCTSTNCPRFGSSQQVDTF